ncbi:hypothetical protein ElyMa_002968300 [Elysia marginata]|uniref:Uncharacterized protein n=1 Tax=Elysia marginata TaxID=1093978 RepID=A0AAV4I837_9GAST|nr:hypothetical protein ElyMa_002968300 [Elysia marginata]
MHIVESRWRLFGHILRRDKDIQANKAMQAYFNQMACRYRGRPTATLPVIINRELSQAYPHHKKLKTLNYLQTMRLLAQDRNKWRTFTRRIVPSLLRPLTLTSRRRAADRSNEVTQLTL